MLVFPLWIMGALWPQSNSDELVRGTDYQVLTVLSEQGAYTIEAEEQQCLKSGANSASHLADQESSPSFKQSYLSSVLQTSCRGAKTYYRNRCYQAGIQVIGNNQDLANAHDCWSKATTPAWYNSSIGNTNEDEDKVASCLGTMLGASPSVRAGLYNDLSIHGVAQDLNGATAGTAL